MVFIALVTAGLSGTLVGLGAALGGIVAAFLLLADFSTPVAAMNAVGSALIWCVSPLVAGLVVGALRKQVLHREKVLQHALDQSLEARRAMEHILDFSPGFHKTETLPEAARTICETAVSTFGCNSCRMFALRSSHLELLAAVPGEPEPEAVSKPEAAFTLGAGSELQEALWTGRPSFVRSVSALGLTEKSRLFQFEQDTVSAIRLPILDPTGVIGLLLLGWDHAIESPSADLLAIIRRFGDQAAIAWEHALQQEAHRKAEFLHQTLQKVAAFAPTFHVRGSREEMARAICEAAIATFNCTAAALYRIELDRLRLLGRVPPHHALEPGTTFPLTGEMALARELRSRAPTFIPDVNDPSRSPKPWPREVVEAVGTRAVLYVPLRFGERGPRNLLILGWEKPPEPPDPRFLVIVQRFADQAALALINASAQQLHARLEASLLPSSPLEHPYLQLAIRYKPGEQRLSLGGDFVGAMPTSDGGLAFIIGDVSGHGPDAAALGANLRSSWKTLVLAEQPLASLAGVLCRMLLSERRGKEVFATVVAGTVDPSLRQLSLVNAGHPPPLLLTDQVVPLEVPPSLPVGPDENCVWPVHEFSLPEKWRLFLYTDGLVDGWASPGSRERFGEERLKNQLTRYLNQPLDQRAVDNLVAEIEAANGGPFADDIAVLCISVKS